MDLPADLDQWDYATIFELATGNEYEPEQYDFKEVLNVTKCCLSKYFSPFGQ